MQFGGQAPGTSQDQRDAAIRKFGFEFDVMDKILVNGDGAHPLYQYLRAEQPTSVPRGNGFAAIEWCAHLAGTLHACVRASAHQTTPVSVGRAAAPGLSL